MQANYNLFLDDERVPKQVKWIELPLVNWVIVRNYDDFVHHITTHGIPLIVSFDHDLALEHYADAGKQQLNYATYREKTGYDCAKFLVEYCLERNYNLPKYYVHSMNTVGKANILSLLNSYTRSRQ